MILFFYFKEMYPATELCQEPLSQVPEHKEELQLFVSLMNTLEPG